ncbi:ribosome-recycling factor [Anaerotruncus colihominis]|uniref:ribosome-recycling factor n=1 Tax=Anaerotruncus colihominis TaxID=169435 RepID=UPI00242C8383|nr:ribosome-recycling factor [Anaerotruncus colihominis]
MKAQLNAYEEKMKKTLDVLSKELAAVRAGRANPAVLDKITVEYYGAPTPLNQVAAIEKAIQVSDLGINPQNDGKQIRLNFPPLTEERRKELIKGVSKTGEESKVALRNIRRDAIDKFKAAQKKSEMTEDELHEGEEKMQKLTDKYVKEVDAMVSKKSKELAEV